MAKKSSKKKMIFLVAVVCGLVAIAMNFLPMLTFHQDLLLNGSYNEVSFNGFQMAFGAEKVAGEAYSSVGVKVDYSSSTVQVIVTLIAFICSCVGVLAAAATFALKKNNKMIAKIVAAVCFVASAVLIVALTKSQFISANEINENFADYYKLAFGAYLACGFNVVAGVASLVA